MSTTVKSKSARYIKRSIGLFIVALILFWYYAPPRVVIYYANDGHEDLSYVLNTQHTIVRGSLHPGKTTGDVGHVFPDDEFFMELYWWSDKGRNHCVNITPKWPTTHIYLDANGDIDRSEESGTDTDRLKPCITDNAKP